MNKDIEKIQMEAALDRLTGPSLKKSFRKMHLNEFKPVPSMIYILAQDHRQASLYCQQNDIPPKLWRYIHDEYSLDGVQDVEVRMITNHLRHPKYWEISERLKYLENLKRITVKRVDW